MGSQFHTLMLCQLLADAEEPFSALLFHAHLAARADRRGNHVRVEWQLTLAMRAARQLYCLAGMWEPFGVRLEDLARGEPARLRLLHATDDLFAASDAEAAQRRFRFAALECPG